MTGTAILILSDVRYQFSTVLVPVYYWKTVEIMITDVNYSEIGSSTTVRKPISQNYQESDETKKRERLYVESSTARR